MLHPIIFLIAEAVAVDGDTFKTRADWGWQYFRIAGIAAPERRDAGGPEATAALAEAIEGQNLHCRMTAPPSFTRLVVSCRVLTGPWRTQDLGCEVIRRGHAMPAADRFGGAAYAHCLTP